MGKNAIGTVWKSAGIEVFKLKMVSGVSVQVSALTKRKAFPSKI
jgi:hypothetical protein